MARRSRSVRLFESEWLERLSRVHPAVPALLWVPVIVWLLGRSLGPGGVDASTAAWLAAGGLVAWTLVEYLVHRFLFHMKARSRMGRRFVFIVHGVHHEDPDDPMRLVMPPAPAIVGCGIVYALLRVALGPAWVAPFFAFFLVGYLGYDYIHLAAHRGRPRTRIGRFLRRWHMLHHHATPEARWGVSSPAWDHVFRTAGGR